MGLFGSIFFIVGMVRCVFGEAELKTEEAEIPKGGIYSSAGKRDPFKLPSIPDESKRGVASASSSLEKFTIDQFSLKAILKSKGRSSAMFSDQSGKLHILNEGETIGREGGTVSRILTSEVIVTGKAVNFLGQETIYEKIISLPK